MPLVPRHPRDNSSGEKERFESDTKAYKLNPEKWGGVGMIARPKAPQPSEVTDKPVLEEDISKDTPEPESSSQHDAASPENDEFQPLTDKQMESMTKVQLELHALALPGNQSFNPDRRFGKKKIMEEIKVRYGNLNLHKSG